MSIKEDEDFNKDLAYIAMACFFISLKTWNYLLPSQFIVECFCNLKKITDENEKAKIKEKMLFYESDIFFIINFTIGYALPYPYLKAVLSIGNQAVLNYIIKNSENNNTNNTNINNTLSTFDNDESKIKHIKEIISEIVNFSFLFPFFLNYTSEVISLSCLKLALKRLNIKINIIDIINIIISQKETEIVSIDVNDINDIEICSSLIDELILSKLPNFYPHSENNIINNINNINRQNFFVINAEYDAETKHKMELKEKSKNETLLSKKRK